MGKIKNQLKKSNTLLYLHRVIQLYKNVNMRKAICNCSLYGLMAIDGIKNYGEDVFYYISQGNGSSGFFAEYMRTVDALAYAECFHMKPYVFYNKNYMYAENEIFMGTDNAFEYYFEQISPEYKKSVKQNVVIYKDNDDRAYMYLGINQSTGNYALTAQTRQIYVSRAAGIVRKYLHFNKYTQKYLDENISKILQGKKTLGVHVRGGEWRKPVKHHPISVPLEEHIEHTKKVMENYGFEQIFLATDEREAIEAFTQIFKDKVVYYADAFRGESGKWLAATQSERNHHRYNLGLEVLRDAETLANCDGMIAGLSNVALYAEIRKESFYQKYEYLYINNKGINNKGPKAEELSRN